LISVASRIAQANDKEEKLGDASTKRKGHPATQAAFSSRENSSNGGKFRQNFMAESYERKKGCVNIYLGNKYLYFQQLTKKINMAKKCLF
jgi:hypothetical protein